MNGDHGRDGLRHGLDSMIALESLLEESILRFPVEANAYLEAPTLIGQLHSLVKGQGEALQDHVRELAPADIPPIGSSILAAFEPGPEMQRLEQKEEAIVTLRALATAFAQAALGYAVLHALAHRSYEVSTADLADQHRRNYMEAAQAIHQAVADVAAQDLQEAEHACRCECPACSPGICLCWHVHSDPDVTGLGASTEGIVVRTPRAESNAERAGLCHGDVILAVDGREVRSYQDMLDRMRDHQPGEQVGLLARRGTGDPQTLTITR